MVANQNAIKQYRDISRKAQDNKEKIQALEHHHMVRFGKSMPPRQYQYGEDELAFTEGKL